MYDLTTACSAIYFALIWHQYKMTQYNTLNVKLSNSKLNKLKSGIKNGTKVTLKISSNVVLFVILMIRIIFLISCY